MSGCNIQTTLIVPVRSSSSIIKMHGSVILACTMHFLLAYSTHAKVVVSRTNLWHFYTGGVQRTVH